MNGKEILEKLKEMSVSASYLAREAAYDEALKRAFGPIEEVEQVGGEGQGDHWHVVFRFVDHGVLLRVNAWYSSYGDTEFNEAPFEVVAKEKTVTVYEAA